MIVEPTYILYHASLILALALFLLAIFWLYIKTDLGVSGIMFVIATMCVYISLAFSKFTVYSFENGQLYNVTLTLTLQEPAFGVFRIVAWIGLVLGLFLIILDLWRRAYKYSQGKI